MKKMILSVVLAAGVFQAQADVVLEYQQGQSSHRIVVAGEKVRMDSPKGDGYMIYDAAKSAMYMVTPRRKEYMVMDAQAMEKMSGMMNAAMQQMEAQLAQLPPAQREQMRQMMGGMMGMQKKPVQVEMNATGEQGRGKLGRCEWYQMKVNGKPVQTACLADADAVGVPADDLAALQGMFAFLKEMLSKVPMIKAEDMAVGVFDEDKLPIIHRNRMGQNDGELVKVSQGEVDAGLFVIPAGYRQRTMDEMTRR